MLVVGFGLWWFAGVSEALSRAGNSFKPRSEVASLEVGAPAAAPAPVEVAEPAPEPKKRKKARPPAPSQSEPAREITPPPVDYPEAAPAPVTRAPEPQPVQRASEPRLGVEEDAPEAAKGWVEAEDKTYVGKVVACEGAKYDGSTVMGGEGVLNHFYLCLDVGSAFTKVKVDNLMNPVMFSYRGAEYRAVQLRKNDVVRVRVNDGAALKVEMVKSVRD
jgi:hypothetical protein